mmetsp:Transcript_40315/g.34038  ORF Transcript_40315/g.34038 Transcript_40315/m.34038 type:complete len:298 (-) Transcript_40315:3000-3893(-)
MALGGLEIPALALCIADNLVLLDLADSEVLGLRIREVKPRNRGRGKHCKRFGKLNRSQIMGFEKRPHLLFLRVIGLRRITGSRTNAVVFDLENVILSHVFLRRITPLLLANVQMQLFTIRFGKTVGERLRHDLAVVVVLCLERGDERLHAEPRRHCKQPDVVLDTATLGRDEVGHGEVLRLLFAVLLLTESVQHFPHGRALLVLIDLNVVTHGVGREESNHTVSLELASGADTLEHLDRIVEDSLGFRTHVGIIEDAGIATVGILAPQLPHGEKGIPVDVGHQIIQRHVVVGAHTKE